MSIESADAIRAEEPESLMGRYPRRSREEVARLAEGYKPFDYDEWVRRSPPATPEELAETEEFLRLRELERQASVAAEAGLYLNGAIGADSGTEPGG